MNCGHIYVPSGMKWGSTSSPHIKVSWKLDARKCQNQLTPPYFDQLSERSQPLCGTLIIDRSTNWKIVVTRQRVWIQTRTQSFYEVGVNFCLGFLGLRKWSKVLFLTMSHSCPRRRWWQERGRRRSQHRSPDGIEALWKLKENSDAVYERSKISKYTILIIIDITNKMNFWFFVSFS